MLYRRGRIWWTEFEHAGVRHRLSTGEKDPRRAAAQARRLRVEVEETAGAGGRPRGVALDALEALDLERVEQLGLGADRKHTISEIWKPLLRELGARSDVVSLSLQAVDAYEGTRRAAGVRGQTIRREVQALVRGLRLAKRSGTIRSLPFDPTDLREIVSDAPKPAQRSKEWSASEIRRVLGALSRKAVAAGWRDRLRLIQLTGLRINELRRIDAEAWVRRDGLHVPPSGAKTITGGRTIPLTPEARAILSLWRPVRGKPNLMLARASRSAGMRAVLTPRDLRAWWITQAARFDPSAAQRLAGHTSLATTSRYVHADAARQRAAARAAAEAAGSPQRRSPQQNRQRQKAQ